MNQDLYDFLYKHDTKKAKKSINEIISKEDFVKKIVWQDDNIFTLMVFTSKNKSNVDSDIEFLKDKWMKEYIACEFIIKDGNLFLHQNFCFFETDGPFHEGLR